MYLILHEEKGMCHSLHTNYQAIYTSDLHGVSESLMRDPSVIIYKLDSLTEIKDVEVSYKEIPKELT